MIRLIDRTYGGPVFSLLVPMYFLEKLCRICVRPGAPLVHIDTLDFDLVRLSEKLESCANLVISKDVISSEICEKCVNKLRVSYHFLEMCKKSTKIIQGYLEKLKNNEEEEEEETAFENSELKVEIKKINHEELVRSPERKSSSLKRKQRITKGQRCSLLQQLLNRPRKERDKTTLLGHTSFDYDIGGLKGIIDFTKNYEFNFKLDRNSNIETTPLDKLQAFSRNFFRRDFSEFKTHVLNVIENQESIYSSDEEDYFSDNESNEVVKAEELTIEPDIKIKREISDDEDSQCPLDYLETSYDDDVDTYVKNEVHSDSENEHQTTRSCIKPEVEPNDAHVTAFNYKTSLDLGSSPAVKLLDRFVFNI
ncbi:hypothetical protein ABEB36_013285 [Hypothenemus hampei]|uniref:ZAD domain-containing protein n=1 Tax=Hypothenemus hampei TaxID=57062 RepID=A0ABD1EA70_HYPHA